MRFRSDTRILDYAQARSAAAQQLSLEDFRKRMAGIISKKRQESLNPSPMPQTTMTTYNVAGFSLGGCSSCESS
jgi:hypothetical protein